ncbi:MAG: hypothetical protein AAGI24_13385 [Pseudomonadota bacterium]
MDTKLSYELTGQTTTQPSAPVEIIACRELTERELQEVGGGIIPLFGFGAALIGHTGVMGATGGSIGMFMGFGAHLITGFSLGLASFQLMVNYHTRDT